MYEEPETVFVADFLGVSNLIAAEAIGSDGAACAVRIGDRAFRCRQGELDARGEVKAMIRPERIGIEPHGNAGENRLPGMVERAVFLGGSHEVHVRVLGGELLKATVANDGRELGGVDRAGRRGQPAPAARGAAGAAAERVGDGAGRDRGGDAQGPGARRAAAGAGAAGSPAGLARHAAHG